MGSDQMIYSSISRSSRAQLRELCELRESWSWSKQDNHPDYIQHTIGVLAKDKKALEIDSNDPSVTVIIPTHRQVPLGVKEFLNDPAVAEVIVVCNGSFTPLSNSKKLRYIHIPWCGHGQTRQLALAYVKTPLVMFSVDDAIPWGHCPVSLMAETLKDPQWDAVVARQIPWPDAPLYIHKRLVEWMPPSDGASLFSQCDHVGTLYRLDDLGRTPIPDVPIGEDIWWSRDKKVALAGHVNFLHSHAPKIKDLWKREKALEQQRCRLSISTERSKIQCLKAFGTNLFSFRWEAALFEGVEHLAQYKVQRKFNNTHPKPY
jgi:hypothetical protein